MRDKIGTGCHAEHDLRNKTAIAVFEDIGLSLVIQIWKTKHTEARDGATGGEGINRA